MAPVRLSMKLDAASEKRRLQDQGDHDDAHAECKHQHQVNPPGRIPPAKATRQLSQIAVFELCHVVGIGPGGKAGIYSVRPRSLICWLRLAIVALSHATAASNLSFICYADKCRQATGWAAGKASALKVCAELIENGRVSKMCSLPPGFDCKTRVRLEHHLDSGAGVRDGYRRSLGIMEHRRTLRSSASPPLLHSCLARSRPRLAHSW